MSLLLDVNHALSQYLPQNTHSCDFIGSIPSSNTSIILPNWTCNDFNYTVFDFSRFTNVESIEIGNDSFLSVQTFRIDGLNKLQTLKIGKKSFYIGQLVTWAHYKPYRSFIIVNCELLTSIDIGEYSFNDFGGEFELRNLPSLQHLKIGEVGRESFNFYQTSLVIKGILISNQTEE